MKIAVRRILLLGALLAPPALHALGLGDIRLKSALNQPFDAEIQLVDASAEDLAALRASIASNDTFARYGLDRPAYLSEFTFAVDRNPSGQSVLRVTSPRPVTEPFVTFLIDANWPRGRLLREYTVLLDPPVYAPGPAVAEAPVATPRPTTAAPPPAPAETYLPPPPAEERAPTAASASPAPSGAAASGIEPGSTYTVQDNDTLWEIASGAYAGTRSDVNRAMLAIYQANPQAFDGNINVLRSGSELAMPDAAAIGQISASEAAAEVARQYRQWRGAPAADSEGRLKLVTPEQGSAAASTAVPSAAPAAPGADSQLQARVRQLEAELAEARRLLEVRNAELSSLQGQAVPPPAAEPGASVAPEATPTEPVAEAPTDAAPVTEEPIAEPEPMPEPVTEEPTSAAQPAASPAAGPSLLDRAMQYWWAFAALALLMLAYVFFRRRRQQAEGPDAFEEVFTPRDTGDLRSVKVAPRREDDIVVEEKRPIEAPPPPPPPRPRAVPTPAPVEAEPARKPVSMDDTISSDSAVSIEAGDPLAEADFHMAYGLYDQAADLVQLAIKREPQRRDLRLKLLEIFFVWGNRDRFLEVAREMHPERASMSASEWDKVLIMGKQMAPEDRMFSQAAGAGATSVDMELAATQQLTDLDFLAEGPESTGTDIDLDQSPTGTENAGIDFILDEPLRGADLASLAPTIESQMFDPSAAEPTEEVALENLGLEVEEVGGLEDAEDMLAPGIPSQVEDTVERPHPSLVEDTVERPVRRSQVEDTVERPVRRGQLDDTVERPAAPRGAPPAGDADDTHRRPAVEHDAAATAEEDTLSQSGITRTSTQTLKIPKIEDTGIMPLLDPTGELPTIDPTRIQHGLDEPATMSEVGTKLDLARAYIDMGDPEGARSILEEVLQEGSNTQKQEAQRLMSSLP